jgi:tetratricopeptide (TPR) repeat protein
VIGLSGTLAAPRDAPVARTVLALLAVVLIAWFGLLARNHAIGAGASQRIADDPGMGAADWERAIDDFRRAGLLDPSTQWDLVRAQYLLLRDQGEALRVAEQILRREPDNLAAWFTVQRASEGFDERRYERATREIERLNPLTTTR